MEWLLSIIAATVAFFSALFVGAEPIVYELPRPMIVEEKAEVLFGGDLFFDRAIRIAMEKHGPDYPLSCIAPTLQSADIVVANLEGPITSSDSQSVGTKPEEMGHYTFTFPTSTVGVLFRHNIRLVNLGNNHIMNFGRDGLLETKALLDGGAIGYFGNPDAPESERVARVTTHGVLFSFVNWSDWTSDKTDHTVAQVRAEAREGRVVVVYTHWGEEYVPATERMKRLAHDFVDAGARLVAAGHPPILQEHEVYKGSHIYYSLGNVLLDQYWEAAVREGLLLKVTFDRNGVEAIEEIPTESQRDGTVCLLKSASSTLQEAGVF